MVTNLSVYPSCLCICSFCFWGKYSNSWIWDDIGRSCLLGHRKKITKFLMRTFTCRSTFLYGTCSGFRRKHPYERWWCMNIHNLTHIYNHYGNWIFSQILSLIFFYNFCTHLCFLHLQTRAAKKWATTLNFLPIILYSELKRSRAALYSMGHIRNTAKITT